MTQQDINLALLEVVASLQAQLNQHTSSNVYLASVNQDKLRQLTLALRENPSPCDKSNYGNCQHWELQSEGCAYCTKQFTPIDY